MPYAGDQFYEEDDAPDDDVIEEPDYWDTSLETYEREKP